MDEKACIDFFENQTGGFLSNLKSFSIVSVQDCEAIRFSNFENEYDFFHENYIALLIVILILLILLILCIFVLIIRYQKHKKQKSGLKRNAPTEENSNRNQENSNRNQEISKNSKRLETETFEIEASPEIISLNTEISSVEKNIKYDSTSEMISQFERAWHSTQNRIIHLFEE
ncbi:hypothetical protein SSS_08548 [Sarcoptes scabiei]|uniref:Uncharacterized protein n=1 Tax=Sarcoptes scabiei TaxID=52283 RepID=A0A834RL74_SARSC|nr:hypothetical protein SSS_08548 [Sarcoptes scabiei]